MPMTKIEMIEEFICPGCVNGSDTKCGKYKPCDQEPTCGKCLEHVLGTIIPGIGGFALGMPKGFNRPGWCCDRKRPHAAMTIRVWTQDKATKFFVGEWDKLNIPVWYFYDRDRKILFVRTYAPRINEGFVDVVETDRVPTQLKNVIDVSTFYTEID